jgi:hypothetical protein
MRMTTLLNQTDGRPDELALIRSEPISMQWTNELRKNVRLHPSCKVLSEVLSLDLYTRTVVYPFPINKLTCASFRSSQAIPSWIKVFELRANLNV